MKNFPTILASVKKQLPKAIGHAIEAFVIGTSVISISGLLHDRYYKNLVEAYEEKTTSSEDVTE